MAANRPRRILIAGLGVAGATLAWWLAEFRFEVTVVERAPRPRTSGYMIDFWGLGYEVAERMGLIGDLRARGYQIDQIRLVGADGRRLVTIRAEAVRKAMGERFFSLMRGDLAGRLREHVGDRADIRFGDSIASLRQHKDGVEIGFEQAGEATFDLVVGADGVHSAARAAIVPEDCEHALGYWTAAFSAEAYPHRDPDAYVSYTDVGRQVARYALRDDRTAFFFVFRAPAGEPNPPRARREQELCLRAAFADGAWECAEILALLDDRADLYFDSVSQVRAPRWSSGRVALVGDAAWCPSLLAGEGASLAMAGAYVLAGELDRCGDDHAAAFERYDRLLRPMIERKQRGALWLGGWFAPKSALGLAVRNGLSRLAAIPAFTPLLIGDMLSSGVVLPDYGGGD
ncbi:MAG TPA: FAD-dependent monooxygenase [Caulobacteraceae bacterium]|nr:FAD-dependent monooxygenase [Caulobacteraceae bacterium]